MCNKPTTIMMFCLLEHEMKDPDESQPCAIKEIKPKQFKELKVIDKPPHHLFPFKLSPPHSSPFFLISTPHSHFSFSPSSLLLGVSPWP